ncbi:porin [Pseudogemmobacter faecipullorum]|uniref:Porin n=1 Tax=Pseudogemmobacter faecipullorum TaxID=2755041 RepID=A0ABS8CHC3_9RHOB|nr:porin [Pseudogemmobacter faecipullorum]MCB5408792.1 porin [Pseudogemmobacter faecipullorum]
MKKLLIATTALVAGASAAAADVTISGYGRFGLEYVEDRGVGLEDTQIASRLRLNIDATTETDVGVTFGARLRFQNSDSAGETTGNQARFSVGYEGLNVQVGNVDTPWDSVGLTYDSEMGFQDSSFGDAQAPFFAYNSTGDAALDGYTGIAATYSISGVNLYFAYVDPDQTIDNPLGFEEEISIAADWTNGQISVAAAILKDGAGIADNDQFFLGGAYSFGDAKVGLNYYDYDLADSNQVTLYGNYAFGATTLRAYVSEMDIPGVDTDTAYGIGADYSLGEGARLSGSIQSGFAGENVADVGVRFDF